VFCFHLQIKNLEAVAEQIHQLLLIHMFQTPPPYWDCSNFFFL